jgi:hypothetical protein
VFLDVGAIFILVPFEAYRHPAFPILVNTT